MFNIHKKPQGDAAVKKSVQKILDPKKDIVTRLKHLKLVLGMYIFSIGLALSYMVNSMSILQ